MNEKPKACVDEPPKVRYGCVSINLLHTCLLKRDVSSNFTSHQRQRGA
jgi:hypothetical protein